MPVVSGPFHLSVEQRRFFELPESYSTLASFWKLAEKPYLEEGLQEAMKALSHVERVMAQFFHAVWSDGDPLNFGLIEATSTLEDEERAVIAAWRAAPFYP